METSMAFRVAKLQDLASPERSRSSQSLRYESPSNNRRLSSDPGRVTEACSIKKEILTPSSIKDQLCESHSINQQQCRNSCESSNQHLCTSKRTGKTQIENTRPAHSAKQDTKHTKHIGSGSSRQSFLNLFEEETSTELSSVDQNYPHSNRKRRPSRSSQLAAKGQSEMLGSSDAPSKPSRRGSLDVFRRDTSEFVRTEPHPAGRCDCDQLTGILCQPEKLATGFRARSARSLAERGKGQQTLPGNFPHLLSVHEPVAQAPCASIRTSAPHFIKKTSRTLSSDYEDMELLDWKGWKAIIAERQREMEHHMQEQRSQLSRREVRKQHQRRVRKRHERSREDDGVDSFSTEPSHDVRQLSSRGNTTDDEDDPLGISAKLASGKRFSPVDVAAGPQRALFQHAYPGSLPSAHVPPSSLRSPGAGAPQSFYNPSFPTPAFYPSWPPPYYAAAMAAAAAARRAGEKAGMTGQEIIQQLKIALEETKSELKKKEEEARAQLEEQRKKHDEEKAELEKQLLIAKDTLEQQSKEAVLADAKHSEAEKHKRALKEEFDILTRVHKDSKEDFQREKDNLILEKNELLVKVQDLEKNIEFANDQLLVARESLMAARARQQTATLAHEQDLKMLQEYRRENEALQEDNRYLRILNVSLNEKVQRLAYGTHNSANPPARPTNGKECHESVYKYHPPQSTPQCSIPLKRTTQHASPTLQELFSPQLQQKLLRDRQKQSRGAVDTGGLKEATFTIPSSGDKLDSNAGGIDRNRDPDSSSAGHLNNPAHKVTSEERSLLTRNTKPAADLATRLRSHPTNGYINAQRAFCNGPCGGKSLAALTEISPPHHEAVEVFFAEHLQDDKCCSRFPSATATSCSVHHMTTDSKKADFEPYIALKGTVGEQAYSFAGSCVHPSYSVNECIQKGLPTAGDIGATICSISNRQTSSQSRMELSAVSVSNEHKHANSKCPAVSKPARTPVDLPDNHDAARLFDQQSRRAASSVTPFDFIEGAAALCPATNATSKFDSPFQKAPALHKTGERPLEPGASASGRNFVPRLHLAKVSPPYSSCGTPGSVSSARTQWLLNRVSRISRLHGLQHIQSKLQDLPPALFAASEMSKRATQSSHRKEEQFQRDKASQGDERKHISVHTEIEVPSRLIGEVTGGLSDNQISSKEAVVSADESATKAEGIYFNDDSKSSSSSVTPQDALQTTQPLPLAPPIQSYL